LGGPFLPPAFFSPKENQGTQQNIVSLESSMILVATKNSSSEMSSHVHCDVTQGSLYLAAALVHE